MKNSHHLPRSAAAIVVAMGLWPGVTWAQEPNPEVWATNGTVAAIATSGNSIFLGGDFTLVGPNTGHFVAVDAASGLPEGGWPRVDDVVNWLAKATRGDT